VIALDTSYQFCNSSLLWSEISSNKLKSSQIQTFSLSHPNKPEITSSTEILVYPQDILEDETIDECYQRFKKDPHQFYSSIRVDQMHTPPTFITDSDYDEESDILISCDSTETSETTPVLTMYKRVDKKVKPVSGTFPQEACIDQHFPHNPLQNLITLTPYPPKFIPSERLSYEHMNSLKINSQGFLWPEEEKLFQHIMLLNQDTLAFEETDRGTLKESYFTPYIIPTIPHVPWEYKYIPIPPGIRQKVIELLKSKINAGAYEPSQSAYRSQWFCVLKKNGKLRLVHDLQSLNKISIQDAGLIPIVDDFVESFAGAQCYTIFDLFWGFNAHKMHPDSRDLTAFLTPLGLL